ncbi:MAG: signal peptidase I [Crocinitomicaceae bacterium]
MGYLGLIIGYLIIILTPILGMWNKRFEDIGKKPIHGFIPFVNYFQLLKACKLPWYWVIFLLFPGVQFIMWASLNVTYIRKFGEFGVKETVLGILFPFPIFWKIAKNPEEYKVAEPTNWDIARQVDARTPSDHVALFFALPVVGHLIAYPLSLLGFKRKPGKKSMFKEWGDAILFALIAASVIRTYVFEPYQIPTGSMEKTLLVGDQLFVDKITYGPRVPMTPFSFPIFHNMIPYLNVKSYSEIQTVPYTRLPGLRDVDRNDVIVFNFPQGDTAINDPRMPHGLIGHTYSQILIDEAFYLAQWNRSEFESKKGYYIDKARKQISEKGIVKANVEQIYQKSNQLGQPMFDQYGNAIIEIERGIELSGLGPNLFVRPVDKRENYIKRCVALPGDSIRISDQTLYVNGKTAWVSPTAQFGDTPTPRGHYHQLLATTPFNPSQNLLSYFPIFPNDPQYDWTEDNFGPLQIPKAGDVVELNEKTIPIYRRIIHAYEGHELSEREDGIYVDGKKVTQYTIEQDYYWMMGDNRNGSADSRFWGFVPEDHIVGHAAFTWLSIDPQKGMFGGMRWSRMFNLIE